MELCLERERNPCDIMMAILWGSTVTVPNCNILSNCIASRSGLRGLILAEVDLTIFFLDQTDDVSL